MKIKKILSLILDNELNQPYLFKLSLKALGKPKVLNDDKLLDYFTELRLSTRHAAILGCGLPLDYELLKKDTTVLLKTLNTKVKA